MEFPIDFNSIIEEVIALAILGIIGFIIKEFFGHNVIVKKIKEKTLIDITGEIREQYSITSNNEPFTKLFMYSYRITNWGFRDIENLKINIVTLRKYFKAKPIDFLVIDSKTATTSTISRLGDYADGLTIERPFLNSIFKDKSEELVIQITSFADFEIQVSGGGKGWGIVFKKSIKDMGIYFPISILITISLLSPLILLLEYFNLSYYFLLPLGLIVYSVSIKLLTKNLSEH